MKDLHRQVMGALTKMAVDITEIKHFVNTQMLSKQEIFPLLEKISETIDLSRRERLMNRAALKRCEPRT